MNSLPILFSLFINDLEEVIGEGIWVGYIIARLLIYCNDLDFFTDIPKELQTMINRFE